MSKKGLESSLSKLRSKRGACPCQFELTLLVVETPMKSASKEGEEDDEKEEGEEEEEEEGKEALHELRPSPVKELFKEACDSVFLLLCPRFYDLTVFLLSFCAVFYQATSAGV